MPSVVGTFVSALDRDPVSVQPGREVPARARFDDSILNDSRLAAALFAAGAVALLVGAALGLNDWPAQRLVAAAASGSGKELFFAFHGYALVLLVLFWGSRPGRLARWSVVLAGSAVAVGLWLRLDAELNFTWGGAPGFPMPMMLATAYALPALVCIVIRVAHDAAAGCDAFGMRLRWLFALTLLFMMVPQSALSLTATLHPSTWDMFALHWDRAAGIGLTPEVVQLVDAVPALPQLVAMAYGLTPLGFLAVALLHLRGRPAAVPSGLLVWVGLTLCAMVAYNFFPVTGPKYVFGSDHFVARLADASAQPLALVQVQPFPRNGVPSMHFGWMLAATVLWWRSGTRWWSRAILVTMTTLTGMATLYNGEHYTVDLIVAVPFVLAALALCTTDVPWSSAARRGIVVSGFATWLVWVLLMRTQTPLFIESPSLIWLLLFASTAVVVQQARWTRQLAAAAIATTSRFAPQVTADALAAALQRRFGLMFLVSGMAALAYQVLFAKELALVFGSTSTATLTVLATFLGGMAIGSLIGGLLAHRCSRPLFVYALVEVGIAVYCVATPLLFEAIRAAYVAVAAGLPPDATGLMVLRVVLGATVLLVPTILMGTTLPLLASAIGPHAGRMGTRVAWLYFANTAGAALGAILTAYWVIPTLGVQRTTLFAALLNLLVALGAIEILKSLGSQTAAARSAAEAAETGESAGAASGARPIVHRAALLALGIGGVLSLGLEVVYVHMLSIVAGNSVYAFGLMVATFLLGLSLGGEAARRLLLQRPDGAAFALVLSLFGFASSAAVVGHFWNGIPEYFGSFAGYPAARTFASREAIRGLICCLVMVPPTLFIGASYVLAMDLVTANARGPKTVSLGVGAAVNTFGNIAGVLLFGFVLLPALGGLAAGRVIALGAMALGALVAVLALRIEARWLGAAAASLLVLIATSQTRLDYDSLSSGANVYFLPQRWGQVVDHAESIDGGLTTVTRTDSPAGPVHTLLTNGKFQGNDAHGGEMQAQLGFALAPLLHQEKRERALVIGYGTGVTSRVFHEAGFREVEIAELSKDIVDMADRHFGSVNRLASRAPGVQLHVTDGRNLLLLSPKRYDVITLEISSIWFAGAASLYNHDFYKLARSRLHDDGVLQQWMQLHRLSPIDLLHIVASLRAEFRYVSLYVIGGQGMLVATNAEHRAAPVPQAMHSLQVAPQLAEARQIVARSPAQIAQDRLLTPQGIDGFLSHAGVESSFWVSTDDNLRLEYGTPKANVNDAKLSFAANMALLERFR